MLTLMAIIILSKNILLVRSLKAIFVGILKYSKKIIIYIFKFKLLFILLYLIFFISNLYYFNAKLQKKSINIIFN